MKKETAIKILKQINSVEYYGENDMRRLLSFSQEIKTVFSYVEDKKPPHAYSLQLTGGQLLESEGKLETCIRKPSKKTMRNEFNECKSDFLDVLKGLIQFGDTYNLWEDI